MHANNPEMAKKWEKEEKKMKRETKVRNLIKKMVRETMDEGFAGGLKKEDRKKFDKMRRKQSEVLGYKLAGTDDIKTSIGDATVTEGKLPLLEMQTMKEFYKYFDKFYGPKGLYPNKKGKLKLSDINKAVSVYLSKKSNREFYGDSVDREAIRDILIKQKKLDPTYETNEGKLTEKAKRDYKDEYKKFQSSTKSKKYRAELNKYNRQKGTYGNGDGKDASHKGGKIVGFEKESVNRGRAEKSRLKKEGFNLNKRYIDDVRVQLKKVKKLSPKEIKAFQDTLIKKLNKNQLKVLSKAKVNHLSQLASQALGEGKLKESGILYKAGVKKYGKEGMDKILSAAGKKKSHAEIGAIKDKYEKDKKEGVVTEKKETAIDVARRIVKNKQYEKYKGVMLDGYTANAIMKVYDAVNDSMKAKLEKLPLNKLVSIVWKVMKK